MMNLASTEGDVEMDPALWGELHHHIHIKEMVVAKLPLHGFYRARGVCKKWNSLPWNRSFLEQHSTTSLPKPYFVLHGKQGCHQAILVKNVMLETWVLRPLPAFAFQHTHTSLDRGVVCTCADEGRYTNSAVHGTILNMHTKVFRRLPPSSVACGDFEIAKIAVDECSGSYHMLVAALKGREIWVFDSVTGGWSAKAAPPAPFCYVDDSTHCDGVMYIKWRGHLRDVIMPPASPDDQLGGCRLDRLGGLDCSDNLDRLDHEDHHGDHRHHLLCTSSALNV